MTVKECIDVVDETLKSVSDKVVDRNDSDPGSFSIESGGDFVVETGEVQIPNDLLKKAGFVV